MVSPTTPPGIIRFGPFELDPVNHELRKRGHLIRLRPQALAVLQLLADRAGQIVSREEIHQHIWGNETFVDFERGINFSINQIRAALGDGRLSGCGHSPIPLHWHFVAAADQSDGMASIADGLWRFGNSKIERYDPDKEGSYYLSKLAAHPNGDILFGNLERLEFRGPSDLIEAAAANPYVPEHLKGKASGKYLVVR